MMYEVLCEDDFFVYIRVIEDGYNFHFEKVSVDEYDRWKLGKLEI